MSGRAAHPQSDQAGFVLVMTLLLLGLVSAGATAIMMEARASATEVAGLANAARSRGAAQAGAARAAYGLLVRNDPLKLLAATELHVTVWRFGGKEITLSAAAESDRIDLNAGRSELVSAALARIDLGELHQLELQRAIGEARTENVRLPSVAALVRPCLRRSRELRSLEDVFTVSTGATGVAPRNGNDRNLGLIPSITAQDRELIDRAFADGRSPVDDRRLRRIRPYLSDRSPQYRITAKVVGDSVSSAERQALISLSLNWPHAQLVSSLWLGPIVGRLCS